MNPRPTLGGLGFGHAKTLAIRNKLISNLYQLSGYAVKAVVGRLLRRNPFRRHPPWKSHNGPAAHLLILAEALGKFLQIVIAGGE
ncbi:MAG: hypothetical protein HYU73_01590 [Betaproteobacteria bacterium]|nr:hypothetical protein [Betaproteobacteria bacterium]